MAYQRLTVDVSVVRTSDLGDGRHDLSPNPDSLSTWFAAVWFVTSQKNGISAQGLQRVLGFKSYETARAWMHKLRRAMVRPERDRLSGIVEVDETFVGGVSVGQLGGSSDKVPVMVAVEKPDRAARSAGSGSRSPTVPAP